MRVYIAGPMSGKPSFNWPAFDELAAVLRGRGFDVVSPSEMDSPATRAAVMSSPDGHHRDLPPGETWGYYLSRDVALLADGGIEGVVVLPEWETSKGARLEVFMASQILGLPVMRYIDPGLPGLIELSPWAILEGVRR